MEYRRLGRTGLMVSEIGFGGWGIGGTMWGPRDDRAALAALHRALDLGITFFDTAHVYGDGHSEELIGQVFRERKTRGLVATKIPPKTRRWPPDPATPCRAAFPKAWIRTCTEQSLTRLGLDTLDLQQLHVWMDAWVDDLEWLEALRELRQDGKIRAIGISINDHDPASALRVVRSGVVDVVQVIYNIFHQEAAEDLFPLCQRQQVGVIVRVPFDEGSLTGTLTPRTQFAPPDWRQTYFTEDRLREVCERVERLRETLMTTGRPIAPAPMGSARAARRGPSLPQAALKFCLSHPTVSTVIPGMRRPQHVEENCAASDGTLLPSDLLATLKTHAWGRNFYNFS